MADIIQIEQLCKTFGSGESAVAALNDVSLQVTDGEIFGTVSSVFIREFVDAAEYFNGDVGSIRIITGETKNGREFVTCELV